MKALSMLRRFLGFDFAHAPWFVLEQHTHQKPDGNLSSITFTLQPHQMIQILNQTMTISLFELYEQVYRRRKGV